MSRLRNICSTTVRYTNIIVLSDQSTEESQASYAAVCSYITHPTSNFRIPKSRISISNVLDVV